MWGSSSTLPWRGSVTEDSLPEQPLPEEALLKERAVSDLLGFPSASSSASGPPAPARAVSELVGPFASSAGADQPSLRQALPGSPSGWPPPSLGGEAGGGREANGGGGGWALLGEAKSHLEAAQSSAQASSSSTSFYCIQCASKRTNRSNMMHWSNAGNLPCSECSAQPGVLWTLEPCTRWSWRRLLSSKMFALSSLRRVVSGPAVGYRRSSDPTIAAMIRSGDSGTFQRELSLSPGEKSRRRCLAMLQNLDGASQAQLEEEMEDLLMYKNRHVKARLLHYAIFVDWQAGDDHASTVRRVLDRKADIHGKASYPRAEKIGYLEAIHLAAGFGHVPTMRALVEKVPDATELLNTYCTVDVEPFYAPLHDAAYLGHKEAVVWLLENQANASARNLYGYTPLHWLAKKGHEREGDVEDMVKALLKHKARLDMTTNIDGKIPLELAADDDSGFPRHLVHLLAPSFQAGERCSYSFFDDMCTLSGLNTVATNQLARQLLESEDPTIHARVRAEAQKDNAVDRMANLFHLAPEAAADILQILMVKPSVADSGRHPIRSRASLWGLFYSRTMRCEYQSDVAEKDSLRWPNWKYDSTKSDDKALKEQPDIAWHLRLVQTPDDREERREYVEDVDTKVLLIPNVMDIDIFMALAATGQSHSSIFSKLPVLGIICCLWDNMLPAVLTHLLFNSLDLAVHIVWGLTNVVPQTGGGGSDTNSPLCVLVWWSILLAGLLRDLVNLAWWFAAFHHKWRTHYRSFEEWRTRAAVQEPGTPRPQDPANPAQPHQRAPSLHALWTPQAFFTGRVLLYELPMCLVKARLLWDVRGLGGGDEAAEMADLQQALLTASALLTSFTLIYKLRLMNCCKRVTTILKAFVSGAIREMFLVASLFFSAVVLAFSILKRKSGNSWISLHLYRGLFFGDGDAFDFMGLNPKQQEDGSEVLTFLMICTTVFFNIMILNLTVAVYGSEYDRLEKESEVHLQRERAGTCCELLLSLQKIKLKDPSDASSLQVAKNLTVAAVLAGIVLLSPPVSAGLATLRGFTAACFFAFAQVTFQAITMASHWFPGRDDGKEGPYVDHFLWICHRSNFCEAVGSVLDKEAVQDVVDERVGRLDEEVNSRIRRLDRRVETLSGQLEGKIDNLDSQLRDVVRLLQSSRVPQARDLR